MDGDKTVRVGNAEYVIDESVGDIAKIAASIDDAMLEQKVVAVAVLGEKRNPMTLYLNGVTGAAVVLDLGGHPRPGQMAP